MTPSVATGVATAKEMKLRRRDWILLPAVGLLTIGIIAVSTELLARQFYPIAQIGFQNCFAANDPTGDAPVKPNSVCWERMAESKYQIEYKFNNLGHRADTELSPKAPGTFRIVLIGSSLTQGLFIPREKTFAAMLPQQLSRATGKNIEVYNEASGGKFRGGPFPTPNSAKHFDQVLEAQPDMILWVLTPTDVINAMPEYTTSDPSGTAAPSVATTARSSNAWGKLQAIFAKAKFGDRLKNRWEQTRTSIVLKHLLFASESKDEYVQSYLKNEDEAGFLKAQPDGIWKTRLQNFHSEIAQIEGLAKAAGVPLVAVYVPNRAQAAMISMGNWPTGYDPFKLDNELHASIVSDGETFVDILPDYSGVADPEEHYFPIDGHPDADGHAIISRLLARELTRGSVPALKASNSSEIAMEPGK